MEINGLIDLLTFSEKRRDAFLFLMDGPKKLDEIKAYLDVSTPEIQPQLKKLETNHMIEKVDDAYQLTQLGEIVSHYLKMFFETTESIDRHKAFWNTHDLSTIPPEFLFRIRELNNCDLICLNDCDLFESHKEFMGNVATAASFRGVTCIFIREWIYLFSELSKEGIPIEIIITPSIYEKIKQEYYEELEGGLQNPNAHVYVCEEPLGVSFAAVELLPAGKFFSLSLNFKNGMGHDHKQDLMGVDLEATQCGNDLFAYYKVRSTEVKVDQSMVLCSEDVQKITMFNEV